MDRSPRPASFHRAARHETEGPGWRWRGGSEVEAVAAEHPPAFVGLHAGASWNSSDRLRRRQVARFAAIFRIAWHAADRVTPSSSGATTSRGALRASSPPPVGGDDLGAATTSFIRRGDDPRAARARASPRRALHRWRGSVARHGGHETRRM